MKRDALRTDESTTPKTEFPYGNFLATFPQNKFFIDHAAMVDDGDGAIDMVMASFLLLRLL